jgi:hypothetical protein
MIHLSRTDSRLASQRATQEQAKQMANDVLFLARNVHVMLFRLEFVFKRWRTAAAMLLETLEFD